MSLQSKENSQQNRETTYKKMEQEKSLQENSQQNRETNYKKTDNRTETTYKKTISRTEKQHTGKQSAEQRNKLQNERKFLETIWHKSDIQNV